MCMSHHLSCLFFFSLFSCQTFEQWSFPSIQMCQEGSKKCCERLQSLILCSKPFHVCSIRDQEFALGLQNRLLTISLLKHSAKWLPVYPINTYDHKCIQSKNTTMQVYMWHPVQIKIIYSLPLPYLMISCHNLIGRTMFIELQSIAFHIWSCV